MRVNILQRYIPRYRVPFFEALMEKLAEEDIELKLFAGRPPGDAVLRGDAAPAAPWIKTVKHRSASFRGHNLLVQSPGTDFYRADAVVVGLVGTAPPLYRAIATRKWRSTRVGVWGHVKSYVTVENRLDLFLETALAKRADHVFAYTPSGADFAVSRGIDRHKVTAVMNTVDTADLVARTKALRALTCVEIDGNVWPRSSEVLAFVGGLDGTKRIEFLAEALDILWTINSGVRIIVAGEGAEAHKLRRAVLRGQAILVGYADDELLARVGAIARGIVMPGRIGLVAVHALALDLPVIAAPWNFHAPEFDYLVEGENLFTSEDDPASYAHMMARFASSTPSRVNRAAYPTIEIMADNFARGVFTMLGA